MPRSCESKKAGCGTSDDGNVIQLGFNISVAGKPTSDFEIFVNDKKQSYGQLSTPNLDQITSSQEILENQNGSSKSGSTEEKSSGQKLLDPDETEDATVESSRRRKNENIPTNVTSFATESTKSNRSEDVTIMDEIKNAMGNFEKFSEHLREIPRLSTTRMSTSTPYPNKNNSRSEGNLSLYGHVPRSRISKHDFRDMKYFRKPKPLSSDLFLKPLPAEDYFKKGTVRRYYDMESFHYCASMENLPYFYDYQSDWKSTGKATVKSDNDKSDALSSASDACVSESKICTKKEGNEQVDKQSTSSESTKDIKIFQSGGIIIMQNFKDNADLIDKKDLINSVKLIESGNKLSEKMESSLHSSDESQKLLLNSSSDEVKGHSNKFVQFDLSSCENTRSKSYDSSLDMPKNDCIESFKSDSLNTRDELLKEKDRGLIIHPNQDFISMSTQENDSIMSNTLGMSPTSSTSGKKLEWDSGADVGYLNMDPTKENISTIERIILKGLSDDGTSSKKKVVYQRTEHETVPGPSKFILERMPLELEMDTKNSSICKRSNSDQSSVPSRVTDTSTATTFSLSSPSFSERADVFVQKQQLSTGEDNSNESEKHQKFSADKSKEARNSKKLNVVRKYQNGKRLKRDKTLNEAPENETPSVCKTVVSNAEEKCVQTRNIGVNDDIVPSLDKSTYVNTLFSDLCFELPLQNLSRSEESGRSESSDKFGLHRKKLKKKKCAVQGSNLTVKLKDKVETVEGSFARHSNGSYERPMSNGLVESSETTDVNCIIDDVKSGEIEPVCDEQKIGKSDPPSMCSLEKPNGKDRAATSRPISASSSSVRTVMPNADAPDNVQVLEQIKNFSDQIIQTNELVCESKGVQAFQSAKCSVASSQLGEGTMSNVEEILVDISGVDVLKEDIEQKTVVAFSKSIQAPGMNFSLPRHLAHPKLTNSCEQMNTKATQIFGGPITSLPNYHSNVPLKEPIDGKVKILKNRINSNIENSWIKQENMKNTFVEIPKEREVVSDYGITNEGNCNAKSVDESDNQRKGGIKGFKKDKNNVENKENLSVYEEELTDHSRRLSSCSRKESVTNYTVNHGSKRSDSMVFGSCEVFPSDDGRNVLLTSEVLKEHRGRIDRNIIQEKYFQSQLQELGRREMISRMTSMEKESEHDCTTQTSFSPVTGVSVSCQYSPSLLNLGEEMVFYPKEKPKTNTKEKDSKSAWTDRDSRGAGDFPSKKNEGKRVNTLERFSYGGFALGEGLSSDTQTADSWVPGGQQDSLSQQCLESKVLSVESVTDHIYDDPSSLKEKSGSDTERNLQLGNSAQSHASYSTPATNSRNKDSESGRTLVLENTDRSPLDSERMKTLDNNLTELEMVVSRLHEKEAIFQKITDSVLCSVSKVNASGDSSHNEKQSRTNDNSSTAEEVCCEGDVMLESSKSDASKGEGRRIQEKNREMSTACQTDTLKPDHGSFDEEKKKLEQRMNDEKEQQIKWIENEIKHLNMLRSLLEKQDVKNSTQRKKRHHYLTEAAEGRSYTASLKEEILRNKLAESLSKTSSSADEIANGDQLKSIESPPLKLTEKSMSETLKLSEPFPAKSHAGQLGMALSLRGMDNVREVTMLPVGIQVTLRDKKERVRASTSPEKRSSLRSETSDIRARQSPSSSTVGFGRQSETQVRSLSNQYVNTTPTTGSIDSTNRCACFKCNKSQCVCLKTADGLDRRRSSLSSSRQSRTREPVDISSAPMSGETSKQGLDIPEIRDIADSRRDSTNEMASADITRSRDSSKQRQSYSSSEGSVAFEKCVCCCHAQPLPRCDICHLLNTCKKCQCYRKIKCCVCEISASNVPLRKKCLTVTTSCYCQSDFCRTCRCSNVKNQVCQTCPCQITVPCETSQLKCKKRFKERSSQTEGKNCTSLQSLEQVANEDDLYRETKYMTERKSTIERKKPSDVVYPSEQKYERELRQAIDEKFPYQMKVPVEISSAVKSPMEMKTGVENLRPEEFQKLPIKELRGKKQCRCNNRQVKRTNFDDHPKNYFLQIQETTEEESSESGDNRNSLEVITIKVPIRKVYGVRNMQSSPQRSSWKTKESSDAFTGHKYPDHKAAEISECNCCEDCIGHSRERASYEEKFRPVDYSRPRSSYETKRHRSRDKDTWTCHEECPGRPKLEERSRPEFAMCDDYEQRKTRSMSYTKFDEDDRNECYRNCCEVKSNKPLKYPPEDYHYQDAETDVSGVCNCCDCCGIGDGEVRYDFQAYSTGPDFPDGGTSVGPSDVAEISSTTESEVRQSPRDIEGDKPSDGKKEKSGSGRPKGDKHKKDGDKSKKVRRKSPPTQKSAQQSLKPKIAKGSTQEKSMDKRKSNDYYNFNKKEFMTKSELEREQKKKRPSRLTLQECLTVKRPDLYTRAECRRKIISEKSKDRAERHNKRMECLTKCLPKCEPPIKNPGLKLFTSEQMKKQTQRFYKKLPEVANKQAEEKKKMQFRTNKIMAEIFAKKLQLQTLKGRLNMSNSFTVMSTM